MKRWLVAIVLVAMVMPAFATGTSEAQKAGFHETGYPIVDTKITLRIFGQKDPLHRKPFNELRVIMKTEKITNVHIE